MNTTITTAGCSRLWKWVRWCVLLLLAVGLIETWLVGGLVVSYRVSGDSMAETLRGVHRDVTCDDCGRRFSCGTDSLAAATWAVCPNCGFPANNLPSLPDVEADRVLIDRMAFSIRAPRRWEITAFRRPSQADKLFVKRIVGLPDESIEIRHGDVYADGKIQRKNLQEQQAMAILVHDADFSPKRAPTPLPRWRPEWPENCWNASGGRFTHAADIAAWSVDWLIYHHDHRLPCGEENTVGKPARYTMVRESPISDVCGYNPLQPRREEDVHAVADLMLSCWLKDLSGQGIFYIRIGDGRDGFEVQLQCDGGQIGAGRFIPCATASIKPRPVVAPCIATAGRGFVFDATDNLLIEVSLFDRQFLLAIDGQTLLTRPIDRSEPPESLPSCPLAIGARGLGVTVSDLRIYRDVYYTIPLESRGRFRCAKPFCLGTDEYYVLGDNSPVSEDSRNWPEPAAVDAKFLLGKPLVAIPSAVASLGGMWHFQVPNPIEIRYIR